MDQKLLQNYRALRQLTWNRHGRIVPRFTAIGAYRQAIEDTLNRKERYPSSNPFYFGSWQDHYLGTDRAYYMDSFPEGWRNLGNVGKIPDRPVNHTGWFTDDDCGESIYGVVLQLPTRHGKPFYIPGIAWTGNDGVSCYPLVNYDNIRECARAADQIAEREAEEERDYQRAWQAGAVRSERKSDSQSDTTDYF
jgi:hypothetical protein